MSGKYELVKGLYPPSDQRLWRIVHLEVQPTWGRELEDTNDETQSNCKSNLIENVKKDAIAAA